MTTRSCPTCSTSPARTRPATGRTHAGEIGRDTCAHDHIDQVMTWLDQHRLGYTAWTWNPWGCAGGNVLTEGYDGTPTRGYGEGSRAHLLAVTP